METGTPAAHRFQDELHELVNRYRNLPMDDKKTEVLEQPVDITELESLEVARLLAPCKKLGCSPNRCLCGIGSGLIRKGRDVMQEASQEMDDE